MRVGVLKFVGMVLGLCVVVALWSAAPAAAATSSAPVWGSPAQLTVPGYSGAGLQSVSCTSDGDCVAVGYTEGAANEDGNHNFDGLIAVESGGAWGTP